MKVLSVIGYSQSGKTTTIEAIVRELTRRRYRVGTVKDIHYEGFTMERPGSNTDRHRKAGADLVTARGLEETNLLFPRQLTIEEILRFYHHDFVILEGVRDEVLPHLICAQNEDDIAADLSPHTLAISGVIANELTQYQDLPVFHPLERTEELVDFLETRLPPLLPRVDEACCQACGMSCSDLLAAMIRGEVPHDACALHSQAVRLKVGDTTLSLVPFVQQVLLRTITGLVSTLDGYQAGQPIEIVLAPDSPTDAAEDAELSG